MYVRNANIMRIFLCIGIFLLFCAMKPFNMSKYEAKKEGFAKKLVKVSGGKHIKKGKIKKVAIAEFTVVYVTSQDDKRSSSKMEFDGHFYSAVTDALYDIFSTKLKDVTGVDVASKADVGNSETYKALRSDEVTKGSSYRGGFGDYSSKRTAMYPASGLGVFAEGKESTGSPLGVLKGIAKAVSQLGNLMKEPRLCEEFSADAVIKVNVLVDYDKKKFRPIIQGESAGKATNVTMGIGYKKQKVKVGWGFETPEGKFSYDYKKQSTLGLKKPLMAGTEVASKGKFSFLGSLDGERTYEVDVNAFKNGVEEIFKPVSEMFALTIKKNM